MEAGIEVGVSKQRRSDIQIVSHQIGDANDGWSVSVNLRVPVK